MTPKEKALKLCQSFGVTTLFEQECNGGRTLPLSIAKKCAIIAVNEIIEAKPTNPLTGGFIELYSDMVDEALVFWKDVKAEIEKL